MNTATANAEAMRLLRDIIEGDDATLNRALAQGAELLRIWRSGAGGLREPAPDIMGRIIALAAEHHGFTVAKVCSDERTFEVTMARHVAMWLCRRVARATVTAIGQRVGRDHTAVSHALAKINGLRALDAEFCRRLDLLQLQAEELWRAAA